MRLMGIVVLLAALVAVPTVSAIEQVTVAVPDASLHVDGYEAPAPTHEALPVQLAGGVSVKPIDISVSETRCAFSTDLQFKEYGQTTDSCAAGELSTSSAPQELVDADIQIIFPAAAEPAAEGPVSVGTAAMIADVMPASPVVVLAAAAAGASAAGIYALWRLLKWTGLAAFVPLYSHISDDQILDDPNRGGIYRLIQDEPGISTKDVADRLDLAWGTVTHHLAKLEKRRFIVSKKYGKYRRYFANGAGGSDQKDALAVLRLDRTGDVAQIIRDQPGLTQKAVSQMLGVSSSTILWHVKRLEAVELVRKVRDGKLVRYYPGEGLDGVALIAGTPQPSAA